MSYVLSKRFAQKTDSDFIIAAARAIYCDWYLSDEKRREKISAPGRELTDFVPETPKWAFGIARRMVAALEEKYQKPLPAILHEWEEIWNKYEYSDRVYSEELAGWYCAMQAMGSGVGLQDYGVDVDISRVEAYP